MGIKWQSLIFPPINLWSIWPMRKSIDDATPAEWDKVSRKMSKKDVLAQIKKVDRNPRYERLATRYNGFYIICYETPMGDVWTVRAVLNGPDISEDYANEASAKAYINAHYKEY